MALYVHYRTLNTYVLYRRLSDLRIVRNKKPQCFMSSGNRFANLLEHNFCNNHFEQFLDEKVPKSTYLPNACIRKSGFKGNSVMYACFTASGFVLVLHSPPETVVDIGGVFATYFCSEYLDCGIYNNDFFVVKSMVEQSPAAFIECSKASITSDPKSILFEGLATKYITS